MTEPSFPPLLPLGSIAPSFHAPALAGNPRYAFDTVAGRAVVLLFHGSAGSQQGRAAFEVLARHRALFDAAPRSAGDQRAALCCPALPL